MKTLTVDQKALLEGLGIRPGMDPEGIRREMALHLGTVGRCGGSEVEIGRRRVRVNGVPFSPAELRDALTDGMTRST
ncbi:MAG: hypothetical protein IKN00_04085 [Bacteroidales bacterium]|nr:hypothetical protein [Bacteroidales bacterium]